MAADAEPSGQAGDSPQPLQTLNVSWHGSEVQPEPQPATSHFAILAPFSANAASAAPVQPAVTQLKKPEVVVRQQSEAPVTPRFCRFCLEEEEPEEEEECGTALTTPGNDSGVPDVESQRLITPSASSSALAALEGGLAGRVMQAAASSPAVLTRMKARVKRWRKEASVDGGTVHCCKPNRLIAPCLCKGTSAYVHEDCLQQWRMATPAAWYKCTVCHYHYRFRGGRIATVLRSWPVVPLVFVAILALACYVLGFLPAWRHELAHEPALHMLNGFIVLGLIGFGVTLADVFSARRAAALLHAVGGGQHYTTQVTCAAVALFQLTAVAVLVACLLLSSLWEWGVVFLAAFGFNHVSLGPLIRGLRDGAEWLACWSNKDMQVLERVSTPRAPVASSSTSPTVGASVGRSQNVHATAPAAGPVAAASTGFTGVALAVLTSAEDEARPTSERTTLLGTSRERSDAGPSGGRDAPGAPHPGLGLPPPLLQPAVSVPAPGTPAMSAGSWSMARAGSHLQAADSLVAGGESMTSLLAALTHHLSGRGSGPSHGTPLPTRFSARVPVSGPQDTAAQFGVTGEGSEPSTPKAARHAHTLQGAHQQGAEASASLSTGAGQRCRATGNGVMGSPDVVVTIRSRGERHSSSFACAGEGASAARVMCSQGGSTVQGAARGSKEEAPRWERTQRAGVYTWGSNHSDLSSVTLTSSDDSDSEEQEEQRAARSLLPTVDNLRGGVGAAVGVCVSSGEQGDGSSSGTHVRCYARHGHYVRVASHTPALFNYPGTHSSAHDVAVVLGRRGRGADGPEHHVTHVDQD